MVFQDAVDRTSNLLGSLFDQFGLNNQARVGSDFQRAGGVGGDYGPGGGIRGDFLQALGISGDYGQPFGVSPLLATAPPSPQGNQTPIVGPLLDAVQGAKQALDQGQRPRAGGAPLAQGSTKLGQGQGAFAASLAPVAQNIEARYGVPALVVLAMAANETGYGQHVVGNNLFGIKALPGQASVNSPTWEVVNGQQVNTNADFRSFDSVEQAAEEFAKLVTSGRYKEAQAYANAAGGDPVQRASAFVGELVRKGYATDPQYTQKITSLARTLDPYVQRPVATQDPSKASPQAQQLLDIGAPLFGQPYEFGGAGGRTPGVSKGFDCSGFVSYVFNQAGVKLTPFTDTMARETAPVTDPQPGDLVFYRYSDGTQPGVQYPHVGIYVGGDKVMDARAGAGVGIHNLSIPGAQTEFHRVQG